MEELGPGRGPEGADAVVECTRRGEERREGKLCRGREKMASYEKSRNQRLEENKRRMEELGLVNLAEGLKKPKVPRKKPEKRKIELHEARRSSRVAAKPVVVYREQLQRVPVPGTRERRERQGLRRRYLTETAREAAVEAAEEVLKDIENPAFVMPMRHSHTSSVFWLGLPEDFCKEHMPLTDEKFMLEDEKGKEWECLYLAHKAGMSGGWRGFAIDHDVMDGDCCVFELVSPNRFKVHIVRFEDEEDDSDDSDEKPRSRKARKLSRSSSAKRWELGDDEEEDDDDEEDESEEEDEGEEEFDSDVCDDHVSEEEEEIDEDSEDDYSPKLSEKEVDTLVAAPSRASRLLKRKIVKQEKNNDNVKEEENDDSVKEEGDGSEGHDSI